MANVPYQDPLIQRTEDGFAIGKRKFTLKSFDESKIDILIKNVHDTHIQNIENYIETLTSKYRNLESTAQFNDRSDFVEAIKHFILYGEYILIIDYENYYFDKTLTKETKLRDYINSKHINTIIIVSKRKPLLDELLLNINPKMQILNVITNGLTLINGESNTMAPRYEMVIEQRRMALNGFGSSRINSIHISNGCDDLLILYIYELCKDEHREPIIYSKDKRIKFDLLSMSNSNPGIYSYKHILPFFCDINRKSYYIEPNEINLKGDDYNFDNFYHERNADDDQDIYLQKYLKYKNKYIQLKKMVDNKI